MIRILMLSILASASLASVVIHLFGACVIVRRCTTCAQFLGLRWGGWRHGGVSHGICKKAECRAAWGL